jgi:hypothetical protein
LTGGKTFAQASILANDQKINDDTGTANQPMPAVAMPPIRHVSKTFKKAPKAKGDEAHTLPLPFEK